MPTPSPEAELDDGARFRAEARDAFDAQLSSFSGSSQDEQDLLVTIQSFSIHFIKEACHSTSEAASVPFPSDSGRQGLGVLWHMFLGTAGVFPSDGPYQAKLVDLLLWTKELHATLNSLNNHTRHPLLNFTIPWESYGFAERLHGSLEEELMTGPVGDKLCNLAAFSARLLAISSDSDPDSEPLSKTALWCLQQTLTQEHTEVAAVLPAAVAWLENSKHKLLLFSIQARHDGGYSMEKWLAWRGRLHELTRHHRPDPKIADLAKRGLMAMITAGRELGYDVPGEKEFAERLQSAMGQELARRGGQGSVGWEDVGDQLWVDSE